MQTDEKKFGFMPVYNKESKFLILGSFPSVKSREEAFYYGNKQNRFWKVLSSFFHVALPNSIDKKRELLLQKHIALWDIVESCNIVGSLDSAIQNYALVDLMPILQNSQIHAIACNGATAYKFYLKRYSKLQYPCYKLPSTSPANTRFSAEAWYQVLAKIEKKEYF